jgi:hypothetical protein
MTAKEAPMVSNTSYNTMALNTIEGALLKGARLQDARCLVYGAQDADGKWFYHSMRKVFKGHDGKEECKTEYEGDKARDAAESIVKIVGVWDAIGLAVKWYRDKDNVQH